MHPGLTPTFSALVPKKKARKPYTITKQRESWTEEEHNKFVEALSMHDRDWKKIEEYVGTKSVIQIRSHAQKHFLKITKNKTGERIPPPRPKRRTTPSIKTEPSNFSVPSPYVHITQPWNFSVPHFINSPYSPSNISRTPVLHPPYPQAISPPTIPYTQPAINPTTPTNVNYANVFRFVAGLFQTTPVATQHAQKLASMNAAERDTIQILLQNLTVNMTNGSLVDAHQVLVNQKEALQGNLKDPSPSANGSPTPKPLPSPVPPK